MIRAAKYDISRLNTDLTLPVETTLASREYTFENDTRRGRSMMSAGGGLIGSGLVIAVLGVLALKASSGPYDTLFVAVPLAVCGITLVSAGAILLTTGQAKLERARELTKDPGSEQARTAPLNLSISPTFGPKRAGLRLAMTF